MTDLQTMNVLFQFTEGAKAIWNGELIAVPEGVWIYDTETRVIKRGNGISLIGDLPTYWDVGAMIDSGEVLGTLPSLISTHPEAILVVNATSTGFEVSSVTIDELYSSNDLANALANLSQLDHDHSDRYYTADGVQQLVMNKSGFSVKNSDVISYLLLDAMDHDDEVYGQIPYGVEDNFEDESGIDATTGDYDSINEKIILSEGETLTTIDSSTGTEVEEASVTTRYSNVLDVTQLCLDPLNPGNWPGVGTAAVTAGSKKGIFTSKLVAGSALTDGITFYDTTDAGTDAPTGVIYFTCYYDKNSSEAIYLECQDVTAGTLSTYSGAIGSAAIVLENAGDITIISDTYDEVKGRYVLQGTINFTNKTNDLLITIGPNSDSGEKIEVIGAQVADDPIIFEETFPVYGANQKVLDEGAFDVEVSRDGGVNYRVADLNDSSFQVGNYKYKGGKCDFAKVRNTENVVLNTVSIPDVKGTLTQFIVDTVNVSGHSSVATDSSLIGQKISTAAGDIVVTRIVGDGTATNSISFEGTLNSGSYAISTVTQVEYKDKVLQRVSADVSNIESLQGDLPISREYAASVTDGTKIYVCGGNTSPEHRNVTELNPETGVIENHSVVTSSNVANMISNGFDPSSMPISSVVVTDTVELFGDLKKFSVADMGNDWNRIVLYDTAYNSNPIGAQSFCFIFELGSSDNIKIFCYDYTTGLDSWAEWNGTAWALDAQEAGNLIIDALVKLSGGIYACLFTIEWNVPSNNLRVGVGPNSTDGSNFYFYACPYVLDNTPHIWPKVMTASGRFPIVPSPELSVHDTLDKTWKRLPGLPTGLYGHQVIYYNNALYVHGGHNGTDVSSKMYRYDIITDTWYLFNDNTPTARVYHTFVVYGDEFYLHGGYDGTDYLKDTWKFDPTGSTWTQLADGNTERAKTSGCVLDDWLFVAGGENGSELKDFYKYSLVDNYWVQLPNLPFTRSNITMRATSTTIHILGGTISEGRDLGLIYSYTPNNSLGTELSDKVAATTLTSTATQDVGTGELNIVSTGNLDPQSITWESVLVQGQWYEGYYLESSRTDSYLSINNNGEFVFLDNGSKIFNFMALGPDLVLARNGEACDVTCTLSVRPINIDTTNYETVSDITPAGLFTDVGNFTAHNATLDLTDSVLTVDDNGVYSGADFTLDTVIGKTYKVVCEAFPVSTISVTGDLVNGTVLIADNDFPESTDMTVYIGLSRAINVDTWNTITFTFTATSSTTYCRLLSNGTASAQFRNFSASEIKLITKEWNGSNQDDFFGVLGAGLITSPYSVNITESNSSTSYASGTSFGVSVAGSAGSAPTFQFATDSTLTLNSNYAVVGRLTGDITSVTQVRLANAGSANDLGYDDVTGYFYGKAAATAVAYVEVVTNGEATFECNVEYLELYPVANPGFKVPTKHTVNVVGSTVYSVFGMNDTDYLREVDKFGSLTKLMSGYLRKTKPYAEIYVDSNWVQMSDGPQNMKDAMSAQVNNTLYLYGGFNSERVSSEFWKYITETATWSQISTMNIPRYGGSLLAIGKYLYLYGGVTDFAISNEHWKYNTVKDEWVQLQNGPVARKNFGAIAYKGNYYIFGGQDSAGNATSGVFRYNVSSDTWTYYDELPIALYNFNVSIYDGYVYIVGGHNGTDVVDTVYTYKVTDKVWLTVEGLPAPVSEGHTSYIGKNLNLYGGVTTGDILSDKIYKFTGAPYEQLCGDANHPQNWTNDGATIVPVGVPIDVFNPAQINTTDTALAGVYVYDSTVGGAIDDVLLVRLYYKSNISNAVTVQLNDVEGVTDTTVSGTIGSLSVSTTDAGAVTIMNDYTDETLACRVTELLFKPNNPANTLHVLVSPGVINGGIIVLGGDVFKTYASLPHIAESGSWSSVDNDVCMVSNAASAQVNDKMYMIGGQQNDETVSDITTYQSSVSANTATMFNVTVTGDNLDYIFAEGSGLDDIYVLAKKGSTYYANVNEVWVQVVKNVSGWKYLDDVGIWHAASSELEAAVAATKYIDMESTINDLYNKVLLSQEVDTLTYVFDSDNFASVSALKLLTNTVNEAPTGTEVVTRFTNVGKETVNIHGYSTRWK